MKRFFIKLLFGNLASKLFLIGSEGLLALSLPVGEFGTFALLQGLILTGAIVSAWGRDQAVVNIVGQAKARRHDLSEYIAVTRRKTALWSLGITGCLTAIAMGSHVSITPQTQVVVAAITMLEAQLIVNAAMFRASSSPYLAVLLLDGMRHLSLFVSAMIVYTNQGDLAILFYFWLGSAVLSYLLGMIAGRRLLRESGPHYICENDRVHAAEIAQFSGLWIVMQSVISRFVLVFSAYLLTPDDLGVVAFLIKLMVIVTFLQSVTIQAVAPHIGRVSKVANQQQAQRIFRLTTFLLAATATPLIGAIVLMIDWIMEVFGIQYRGPELALTLLFFAQALNIGTGIIGQFIIHFGYARDQLFVSVIGASAQCILLLLLGSHLSVPGVLLSYAASNILLVILKNSLGARKIGIHGFALPNLIIIALISCEVLILRSVPVFQHAYPIWILIGYFGVSALAIALAATQVPEIISWFRSRYCRNT